MQSFPTLIGRQKLAQGALQAPGCADPEELPHEDAQVVPGDLNQVSLRHLRQPAYPTAPRAAGLAHVREGALDPLASPSLKLFAPRALDPSPVRVHGFLLSFRF